MNIFYSCPYWGCEKDSAAVFIDKVLTAGYDGIEIHFPETEVFASSFYKAIEKIRENNNNFFFIPQLIISANKESVNTIISKMKKIIPELITQQPALINSHTGKDYYSFDDNCRIIEAAMNMSSKTGIRILHETHRGRFSFHAAGLVPYLKEFPEMELVGDFSHFCTVSESLLQDQDEIMKQIIPYVSHIHARVGFEQGPQVNDPAAPEWKNHLLYFIHWWQQIINDKKAKGIPFITITPEFGPAPYMPALPFTKQPTGKQWDINLFMMTTLKKYLLC